MVEYLKTYPMMIFSSRGPTDVDSLCIHALLTGGFLLSGEQRWRHLFGGTTSSSLFHHSPLASSLSKLQGMSHLALTYLLSPPRISSITSEVTQERTISPLREDHLPTEPVSPPVLQMTQNSHFAPEIILSGFRGKETTRDQEQLPLPKERMTGTHSVLF